MEVSGVMWRWMVQAERQHVYMSIIDKENKSGYLSEMVTHNILLMLEDINRCILINFSYCFNWKHASGIQRIDNIAIIQMRD